MYVEILVIPVSIHLGYLLPIDTWQDTSQKDTGAAIMPTGGEDLTRCSNNTLPEIHGSPGRKAWKIGYHHDSSVKCP